MNYQTAIDTTYIDLSVNQIKSLHEEIFGKAIRSEKTIENVVKLEIAYLPFLIFIIIAVISINTRWNRAYQNIKRIADKMNLSEQTEQRLREMEYKKLDIPDRLFVYLTLWAFSAYIDWTMMTAGIFEFPWLSIPVIILVINKKLRRLAKTSALMKVDDDDIAKHLEEILNQMIITPFLESVQNKITNFLKTKKDE